MRLSIALLTAGLLALFANGKATAQNAESKTEAKGTLTLGNAAYKFSRALAYETVRNRKKQTVVIVSEKALDTTKLKQLLSKKGSDEEFFPFDAHVKLRF